MRIKSHFKVQETATEHVSSSTADESRAKCARRSCEKSSNVPEINTKQHMTEAKNEKTIKSRQHKESSTSSGSSTMSYPEHWQCQKFKSRESEFLLLGKGSRRHRLYECKKNL